MVQECYRRSRGKKHDVKVDAMATTGLYGSHQQTQHKYPDCKSGPMKPTTHSPNATAAAAPLLRTLPAPTGRSNNWRNDNKMEFPTIGPHITIFLTLDANNYERRKLNRTYRLDCHRKPSNAKSAPATVWSRMSMWGPKCGCEESGDQRRKPEGKKRDVPTSESDAEYDSDDTSGEARYAKNAQRNNGKCTSRSISPSPGKCARIPSGWKYTAIRPPASFTLYPKLKTPSVYLNTHRP